MAPFTTNLTTDQAGQGAYADATGAAGSAGYARALQNFQTSPDYQFTLQQGNDNILRNQAATGQLASGATNLDLQKYGQGLANQQWQSYITNLQPFIGASTANAGGAASTNVAKAGTDAGYAKTLADLGYTSATGIGNAHANADLSEIQTNGNIINAGTNFAKSLASFIPFA